MRRLRGLTLVELLVVLTILVALTTVAIRSTEGTLQQSRYDATVRTLQALEDAVLGPPGLRDPDGTPRVSGFVADLGRLALATDVGGTLLPEELWSKPSALQDFGFKPWASDPEVILGAGWRGPYLRLPPGVADLRDGYGNAHVLTRPDGLAAADGDPIGSLRSLGLDNQPGGTGYGTDLDAEFSTVVLDRVTASAFGNVVWDTGAGVEDPDSTNGTNVVVVLFEPNPATGDIRAVPSSLLNPGSGPTRTPVSFPALTTTQGPRLLRAYQGDELDAASIAGNPANLRSQIVRLVLRPGGSPLPQQLVLE